MLTCKTKIKIAIKKSVLQKVTSLSFGHPAKIIDEKEMEVDIMRNNMLFTQPKLEIVGLLLGTIQLGRSEDMIRKELVKRMSEDQRHVYLVSEIALEIEIVPEKEGLLDLWAVSNAELGINDSQWGKREETYKTAFKAGFSRCPLEAAVFYNAPCGYTLEMYFAMKAMRSPRGTERVLTLYPNDGKYVIGAIAFHPGFMFPSDTVWIFGREH